MGPLIEKIRSLREQINNTSVSVHNARRHITVDHDLIRTNTLDFSANNSSQTSEAEIAVTSTVSVAQAGNVMPSSGSFSNHNAM